MRKLADRDRIRRFMHALGRASDSPTRAYLTGGASAVLEGWRGSTIDVDLVFQPESDPLMRALPALKEELQLNVELVSPAHFIPELPGWEARSPFVTQEGHVAFHHYDFYAQALAKIERGHAQDTGDVREMMVRGLVQRARLVELFDAIEPALYRYPALDARSFRRALESAVATPAG